MTTTSPGRGRLLLNFWIDLISLIPFLICLATGLAIQTNYHFHHLPDSTLLWGGDRQFWQGVHLCSACATLSVLIPHILLHLRWFKTAVFRNSSLGAGQRRWTLALGAVFLLTVMTSLISLPLIPGSGLHHLFIEIHDKLGLLLIPPATYHLLHGGRWLLKIGRRLMT